MLSVGSMPGTQIAFDLPPAWSANDLRNVPDLLEFLGS